jgi:hypothetical protein
MDLQVIQTFFMWCTILDGILLVLTGIILTFAGNAVYRIQSRWYPISRDAFNVVIYSFIGLFKLFFIVFNLVPFIVLLIMR